MPMLLALLTVFVGLAIGVVVLAAGHTFLGVVRLTALPVSLAVWLATNNRTPR